MEVRHGEIPLLDVNIASWKLPNVVFTFFFCNGHAIHLHVTKIQSDIM